MLKLIKIYWKLASKKKEEDNLKIIKNDFLELSAFLNKFLIYFLY